ncbi:PAS domain-containing protein [Thalassobaculum sp.]|uniref:PAS domain-containing protein n=1 Tax=Thalassobaculum sp. TaxID=2022740 RepID=UPI003B5BCB0D
MSAVVQSNPGFPSQSAPSEGPLGDAILDPLLSYWSAKRSRRALPCRRDIDPVDIPELLQHIGLIDVEGPPWRFRYRLVGSYMQTMFGENYQGKYLDKAKHGRYRQFLEELYNAAVDQRQPMLSEAIFDYGTERVVTIRRLILPLAESDGQPVNMLLFGNSFIAPNLPWNATPMLHLRMDAPFQAVFLSSINQAVCRPIRPD